MEIIRNYMLVFGSIAAIAFNIAAIRMAFMRYRLYLSYKLKVENLHFWMERSQSLHSLPLERHDLMSLMRVGLHNAGETLKASVILLAVSTVCTAVCLIQLL